MQIYGIEDLTNFYNYHNILSKQLFIIKCVLLTKTKNKTATEVSSGNDTSAEP